MQRLKGDSSAARKKGLYLQNNVCTLCRKNLDFYTEDVFNMHE